MAFPSVTTSCKHVRVRRPTVMSRRCSYNLLYSRQSGFRGMYSTETALIKLVDELLFGLDNNHVCGMVLVDYRKAFDMVDHKLLLRKLELYGIANRELAWCHSYLLDRKQVVRVNGGESSEALMLHGVPQGSILGPLFFILFINDLPLYTSCLLYTSPSPRDGLLSRMPSSA